jgi:hypothetical protein
MRRVTSKKRVSQPAIKNLQEIRYGDTVCAIYRRSDIANGSWFFRTHLKQERRYYRVSLKTTDRLEAKQRAQQEMLKVLAKLGAGQPVMAISLELGELVKAFSNYLNSQVATGQLRARTEVMQRYRIRLGLKFLTAMYPAGLRTRVSEIDGSIFKQYLQWRQAALATKRKTIRRDVVRDEIIVVRKMFKYGVSQKLCAEKQVPMWDFAVEKEPPKRRRIT